MEWQFLLLLIGFYTIGIPVWLIIVTIRLNKTRSEIEQLQTVGNLPVQKQKTNEVTVTKKSSLAFETNAMAEETYEEKKDNFIKEPQPEKPTQRKSLEEQVGLHWFQWLGIAALVIALVFFLKWTFDNGFIGPVGRTVIGYILSGVAIIAGDKLRKKYGIWSLTFTGGGALASYIVTWVAFHMYGLFPSFIALAIYSLTTIVTCLLSGYYKAIPLAVFGIIGGFLTPILTGEGGSIIGLLSYILIIDIGVLALGHFRQWRVLNALTFIATILWQFYALENTGIDRVYALLFMAAFGIIYLIVPAIYNILRQLKSEPSDILMLVGNGLVHFWLLLQWLQKTPMLRENLDAPIALGFAVIFLVVSFGIYRKNKNDTPLVLAGLSLTVLFASIAIPLQLGHVWVSLAWSMEAAFLLWVALRLKDNRIQRFAWPVMIAAYFWYLVTPNQGIPVVFLQSGFLLFILWAFFFTSIAFFALQREDRTSQHLLQFAFIGGIFLTVALMFNTMEDHKSTLSFIERLTEAVAIIGGSYIVLWKAKAQWNTLNIDEKRRFTILGIGVQIITLAYITYEYSKAIENYEGLQNKPQIIQMGISILWAAYAAIALIIGFIKGWKPLRMFSMVLLLIAIGKLSLIDLFNLGTGYRVIGFTILGALLVGASFLYQRNKEQLKEFFVSDKSSSSS